MARLRVAWCDVLMADDCAAEDHFFEMGGDSFGALRLLDRVRAEYGVEIDLAEFFADPSLAALEALLVDKLVEALPAREN
ncbi:hypothetical protein KRMM14A1259_39690 [Krasilnikovia sp. MM14-A1259]